MITTSDSPVRRSGIPNQLLGVRLHTIACSGLSRVRTELSYLLVIPSLAPHPEPLPGWQTYGKPTTRPSGQTPLHSLKSLPRAPSTMPPFNWKDIDHRLVSLKLTNLAEEMHQQIKADERRIQFENLRNLNSLAAPSLV